MKLTEWFEWCLIVIQTTLYESNILVSFVFIVDFNKLLTFNFIQK